MLEYKNPPIGYTGDTLLQISPLYEPIGWDQFTIELARDKDKHGFFADFSLDLQFLKGTPLDPGGFDFIYNAVFYTGAGSQGVEAHIDLTVYFQCTPDDLEEVVWVGRLNLSELTVDEGLCGLTVNLEDASKVMWFLTRSDSDVDLLSRRSINNNTLIDDLTPLTVDDGVNPAVQADPYEIEMPTSILANWSRWRYDTEFDAKSWFCSLHNQQQTSSIFYFGISVLRKKYSHLISLPFKNILSDIEVSSANVGHIAKAYAEASFFPNPDNDSNIIVPVLKVKQSGEYNICLNGRIRVAISGCDTTVLGLNKPLVSGVSWRLMYQKTGALPETIVNFSTSPAPPHECAPNTVPDCCTQWVFGPSLITDDSFVINFAKTENLTAGDEIRFYLALFLDMGDNNYTPFAPNIRFCLQAGWSEPEPMNLTIQSKTTEEVSNHKGFLAHEAFTRIVESITKSTYEPSLEFRSNYFGRPDAQVLPSNTRPYTGYGCGAHTFILNGKQLRNFEPEGIDYDCLLNPIGGPIAPLNMFMSFDTLFDNLSAIYNLGAGIERVGTQSSLLRVENMEYFYDETTPILDIPILDKYAAKFKRKIRTDAIYSKVKIGYENWETNTANGLLEIFSTREYQLGSVMTNNEFERISSFIAANSLIEKTRRNVYKNASNVDTGEDDSYFVLRIDPCRNVLDNFDRYRFIELGDHVSNTACNNGLCSLYNVRITPARNAARFMPMLGGQKKDLIFSKGTGNYIAITKTPLTNSTNCVDLEGLNCSYPGFNSDLGENSNIPYDYPALPKYTYEEVEFEYPLTWKEYISIRDYPYGVIRISTDNFTTYESFFLTKLNFKPNDLSKITAIKSYVQ